MNETNELKEMEVFELNLLVLDKIKYYEELKQQWAGDKSEDFNMEIWCNTRIIELHKIRNKLK
tara:strand:- start:1045 stop:1233 length:189 start_codon:yes stop_codon:yes gene_type:complete